MYLSPQDIFLPGTDSLSPDTTSQQAPKQTAETRETNGNRDLEIKRAEELLAHPDPVVRKVAELAATASMQLGKGRLFLNDPELAIDVYVNKNPQVIEELAAAVKE